MSQFVVIKLPTGSPPPLGYNFVRTIRGIDVYNKQIPKLTKGDIDDLDSFFGNMSMAAAPNVAIVPASTLSDDFINAFANSNIGGKRKGRRKSKRSNTKRKRKGKKTKRRRY